MLKATLNLNDTAFQDYIHLDLERNWRSVTAIRIWLKAKGFDLTLPIFVIKNEEENSLTFCQNNPNKPKNIFIIHPNPQTLEQLTNEFKRAGHRVVPFRKVETANINIQAKLQQKERIDYVIVPKKLKVIVGCTYKTFLNQTYPNLMVLTCDNKEYRDMINMKNFQRNYK